MWKYFENEKHCRNLIFISCQPKWILRFSAPFEWSKIRSDISTDRRLSPIQLMRSLFVETNNNEHFHYLFERDRRFCRPPPARCLCHGAFQALTNLLTGPSVTKENRWHISHQTSNIQVNRKIFLVDCHPIKSLSVLIFQKWQKKF